MVKPKIWGLNNTKGYMDVVKTTTGKKQEDDYKFALVSTIDNSLIDVFKGYDTARIFMVNKQLWAGELIILTKEEYLSL